MSEPQNGRGALVTGGLAAILASTCCLGPLVLVGLASAEPGSAI
jgi:mercuric ion transport protein